jgi:hypothetical protein
VCMLGNRFERTVEMEDLEEAIQTARRAVTSRTIIFYMEKNQGRKDLFDLRTARARQLMFTVTRSASAPGNRRFGYIIAIPTLSYTTSSSESTMPLPASRRFKSST